MSTTVRTLKLAVEILAGQHQGESEGAPAIIISLKVPDVTFNSQRHRGDLWISEETNTLYYWTGVYWKQLS